MLLGIYAEAVVGRCFIKKVFLEISQNLHLCKSLFFNKVAGPRPVTFYLSQICILWGKHDCEKTIPATIELPGTFSDRLIV